MSSLNYVVHDDEETKLYSLNMSEEELDILKLMIETSNISDPYDIYTAVCDTAPLQVFDVNDDFR